MDTIFINYKDSKRSDPPIVLVSLSDERNLKKMITMLLYQILASTICGKVWKSQSKEKFKVSAPTWNEKFELPNGWYSLSNIQNYFKEIIKR